MSEKGCLTMQHIFLRVYASIHLVLIYGGLLSLLPAMGSPLRHMVPDGVLDTLGLLDPSTTKSMLPVLSLLLLVQTLPFLIKPSCIQACSNTVSYEAGSSFRLPVKRVLAAWGTQS